MSIYAPLRPVGGDGGQPFEYYSLDGNVLAQIEVWAGPSSIVGIRVWRSGDEVPRTYGRLQGKSGAFASQPGERITKLSLWGNGKGTRLGAIRFSTSAGRECDFRMTEWGLKSEYTVEVGSGICVGVMGNCGSEIDNLGFVFLNPIAGAAVTNVSYPTLTPDTPSIVPEALEWFSNSNTGQQPREYSFSGSQEEEVTEAWSMTTGLEAYTEVTVQAGIPEMAMVSGTVGWRVSSTSTYGRTQKNGRRLSWESSGTLNPGERVSLVAITRRGRIFVPWSGSMVVTLRSGESFSYNLSGNYSGVAFTDVDIMDAVQAAALGAVPLRIPLPSRPQ